MISASLEESATPVLRTTSWQAPFNGTGNGADQRSLEHALTAWIGRRRWYRTKTKSIFSVRYKSVFALPFSRTRSHIAMVDVALEGGETATYVVPLTFLDGDEAKQFRERNPEQIVALLSFAGNGKTEIGMLVDGLSVDAFLAELLEAFEAQATLHSESDILTLHRLGPLDAPRSPNFTPRRMAREQTNTSVMYGDSFVAKILRKLDDGVSADVEMGRFLTEVGYAHAPALAGWIDLKSARDDAEPKTVGLLHVQVPNRGDAWAHALEELKAWLGAILAGERGSVPTLPALPGRLLTLARAGLPANVERTVGHYVHDARKLGLRIGQMHVALTSRPDDRAFSAEPLDLTTRLELIAHAESSLTGALGEFTTRGPTLSPTAESTLRTIQSRRTELETRLRLIASLDDAGEKTRVHGDLHLGQVLFTGHDFMLIDFEGEPARSLGERKAKRSPFVDVAGMLRSYDYAAATALRAHAPTERATLIPWATLWKRAVSVALCEGWLDAVANASILPESVAAERTLLDFFLFEKCIYEIGYEMNSRPDWIEIPLVGLSELLDDG
ncbi:MAG: putative maltokinase [Polyangiaceae bacterium]|nr:putative maltokinase [Polyangiaceae bacterium]